MRLFIDLDALTLCQAANDNRAVTRIETKRGDSASFEVRFVRDGAPVRMDPAIAIEFACKPANEYDAAALVYLDTFTESAVTDPDSDAHYVGNPSFDTVPLNAEFAIDGDPDNDISFLDVMAEFTWTISGDVTSTKTFTIRIHNDIIRADELTPTPLPVAIGSTAPVNLIAGTAQVETNTVAGALGGTGTIITTITAAGMTGSPFAVTTTVTDPGDDAGDIANKIIDDLMLNSEITSLFDVGGGAGGDVMLTAKAVSGAFPANDATLNISLVAGTYTGLTDSATSTDTTAGVAGTPATATPPYLRTHGGFLYVQEGTTWKKVALSSL